MKMKILWLPDAILFKHLRTKHGKLIVKGYVFNQTNIPKKKEERWGLLKATKWDLKMQGAKKEKLHEKH